MPSTRFFPAFLLSVASLIFSFHTCFAADKDKEAHHNDSAREEFVIPRADPGYIQQLEKRAMLAGSAGMAKIVSGSELAWRSAASQGSPDELLGFAETWLRLHPFTLLAEGQRSALAHLDNTTTFSILRELGAKGLYVAPLGGAGDMWSNTYPGVRTGEDTVQYDFSEVAGNEQQYKRLMNGLIQNNMLMGSDLIPAATGIGPDFFLAARGYRDYPGAYSMVDVPQDLWKVLPDAAKEFDVQALPEQAVRALSDKGLLPKAMRDDGALFMQKTGWAATGKVRGLDGNTRRWVYRYYQNPQQPVLNWEDPSQAAVRILSGGAVSQVGMQGQALIGMNFEALHGLEPMLGAADATAAFSVEPALTAAQTMSRQIRRYGGWGWLKDDNMTLYDIRDFMRGGVDYVMDSAFSPAVEHALLTGDATLLRFMADETLRLGLDTRRFVHTTPAQEGINYTLPHLAFLSTKYSLPEAATLRNQVIASMKAAASPSGSPVKDGFLYSTTPGIAAMALGAQAYAPTDAMQASIRSGHLALIHFKAMQPGVLMLSGQDLVGTLPLDPKALQGTSVANDVAALNRGGYALTSLAYGTPVTRYGLPSAKSLYGPADIQVMEKQSFLKSLRAITQKRSELGIAKGRLVARPKTSGKGVVALVTELPKTGFVLTVVNFSRKATSETLNLGSVPGLSAGNPALLLGNAQGISGSGNSVSVSLGPWQAASFRLGGKKAGASSLQNEAPPVVPTASPMTENQPTPGAPQGQPAPVKATEPQPSNGPKPVQPTSTSPQDTMQQTKQPQAGGPRYITPSPVPQATTEQPVNEPAQSEKTAPKPGLIKSQETPPAVKFRAKHATSKD